MSIALAKHLCGRGALAVLTARRGTQGAHTKHLASDFASTSVADFQHAVLSQQDQLSMLKNGLEGGTPWAVRQSFLLGLSHKQMAN